MLQFLTKHTDAVMVSCTCTLYGLRTLQAHGMSHKSLQIVFQSTALSKILHYLAWQGFANAGDRNRLEAFLQRAGKSGYYTGYSLPTVDGLRE